MGRRRRTSKSKKGIVAKQSSFMNNFFESSFRPKEVIVITAPFSAVPVTKNSLLVSTIYSHYSP